MKNVQVRNMGECERLCYEEHNCVSITFEKRRNGDDKYHCELNNSTHGEHDEDLEDTENYYYRGTKNACGKSPCKNGGTCQSGFTKKRYRCLCPPGFTGGRCTDDIDECDENTHKCDSNAQCCNTNGSYRCQCKANYAGDGYNCTELPCGTVFDFEHGLSGWNLTGTVFNNQRTYGDNPTARDRGEPSNHTGDWWIGGYENRSSPSHPASGLQGDGPKGTMTSPSFVIFGNSFTFLIGGGCKVESVRAELIVEETVVLKETGKCKESMTQKRWDVSGYIGEQAQLRLIDNSSGEWGHINFDHFKEICS